MKIIPKIVQSLPILICSAALQAMEPAAKRIRLEPITEIKVAAETKVMAASAQTEVQTKPEKSLTERGFEAFPLTIEHEVNKQLIHPWDFFEALFVKHVTYNLPPATGLQNLNVAHYFNSKNMILMSPSTLIQRLELADLYTGPAEYIDDEGEIISKQLHNCCRSHVWTITKDSQLIYKHTLGICPEASKLVRISDSIVAGITTISDTDSDDDEGNNIGFKIYLELWDVDKNELISKLELADMGLTAANLVSNMRIYKLPNDQLLLYYSQRLTHVTQLITVDISNVYQPALLRSRRTSDAHNLFVSTQGHIILSEDPHYLKDDKGFTVYDKNFNEVAHVQHEKTRILHQFGNTLLVSGSEDGVAKIWDMTSWKCIKTLQVNAVPHIQPQGGRVPGFTSVKKVSDNVCAINYLGYKGVNGVAEYNGTMVLYNFVTHTVLYTGDSVILNDSYNAYPKSNTSRITDTLFCGRTIVHKFPVFYKIGSEGVTMRSLNINERFETATARINKYAFVTSDKHGRLHVFSIDEKEKATKELFALRVDRQQALTALIKRLHKARRARRETVAEQKAYNDAMRVNYDLLLKMPTTIQNNLIKYFGISEKELFAQAHARTLASLAVLIDSPFDGGSLNSRLDAIFGAQKQI